MKNKKSCNDRKEKKESYHKDCQLIVIVDDRHHFFVILVVNHCKCHINHNDKYLHCLKKQENQKKHAIALSNAIIHPRTVMIKS
jgi:hypothetical protein